MQSAFNGGGRRTLPNITADEARRYLDQEATQFNQETSNWESLGKTNRETLLPEMRRAYEQVAAGNPMTVTEVQWRDMHGLTDLTQPLTPDQQMAFERFAADINKGQARNFRTGLGILGAIGGGALLAGGAGGAAAGSAEGAAAGAGTAGGAGAGAAGAGTVAGDAYLPGLLHGQVAGDAFLPGALASTPGFQAGIGPIIPVGATTGGYLPGFTPGTANALGLPNPVTGKAPVTGGMPGQGPGISAGGGIPAGGGGAGVGSIGTGTAPSVVPPGTSFVDGVLNQLKQNSLGLGLAGASLAMSTRQTPLPNEEQINALGQEGAAVARQLIGQYRSGALSQGQQASLDEQVRHAKNQITNYFANIGQADSTAHMQALMQVDQTGLQLKQQMLDNALQQGLQAIGVASGPLNTIAQYQLSQDRQLADAFGRFAGAVGNLMGRNAGTPAPQPTGTTATYMPTML